jgi:hypothetical protein
MRFAAGALILMVLYLVELWRVPSRWLVILGRTALFLDTRGGTCSLHDGDVIIVGTSRSPYAFKLQVG